jgi:hypothetical protein
LVPLGDVEALHAWGEREDPGYRLWKKVSDWITDELGSRPWAAPSAPALPMEGQPVEIRTAIVPGTTVTVIYEHRHETGQVDLLYVGQ